MAGKRAKGTRHHCPGRKLYGTNCSPITQGVHCTVHQEQCSVDGTWHLKKEECRRCNEKETQDARRQAEAEENARREAEAEAARGPPKPEKRKAQRQRLDKPIASKNLKQVRTDKLKQQKQENERLEIAAAEAKKNEDSDGT
ncbi:MAG: hypothetical protein M1828_003221 [Chrysothrix sp. TS-e1954]|nr:MAG: hypothetical protein M1828_003221 [Chrysothrix sp. TS-e1954]